MTPKSKDIFSIQNGEAFNRMALTVFKFQYENIDIYRRFVQLLGIDCEAISNYMQIPFMPIEFFKKHKVFNTKNTESGYFESSGTGNVRSRHYFMDLNLYEESFTNCFELFYGSTDRFPILALLPSYSESPNSSLIYMVKKMITKGHFAVSGFYHGKENLLFKTLSTLSLEKKPVILIGVSFALLDFSEKFKINFPELIIIETGGMKGRRKEILREDLHISLSKAFNVEKIHSEYGMTELFSQAYSKSDGLFFCPPWMKVIARDNTSPLTLLEHGKIGALNIIDLANVFSCSFIATDDLGRVFNDGSFQVLGRTDSSENRGCNLMVI
ncbi:MAG: acyltransferase [Bacteroidales bacterium]|nr:acyltransferase [Bacteroidales bacterium]